MTSTEQKSSGGSYIPNLVVGALLMCGGFYLSVDIINVPNKPGFVDSLEKMGIPIDPGQTIAAIGVLLIVFPLLRMFFIGPLAEAIDNRNRELETTFSEAEELRTRMDSMRSEYEQRLVATEADARQRIESQIKEAQSLRQQLMAEAAERADELVKRATEEIEREKQRVLVGLRTQVVDLAIAAAEKVIEANMDNDRNRKIVDDFITEVEVVH